MVASFDKAIPPGQEGKVTLKINTTNRRGSFKQSANVFSNDPEKPKSKISISGFIKDYILLEPSFRVRLKGYSGDKIKKKVKITSLEEQPLEITGITSNIEDKIKYKLKTIKKGKEYQLEIKTSKGIQETFKGKILLLTTSKKKPEIELLIMGELKKQIRVSPEYLYFGIINTSKEVTDPKSLTRTVVVSRSKGDNLSIEKIEHASDWIMTETETNEDGGKYTVIIKLSKDNLPKGKFRETIKIHTKCGEKSEVSTVILEGKTI